MPLHFHIGMTSVIADYIHTRPMVRMALLALTGASLTTSAALTHFNFSDIGITGAIKLLFTM